MQPSLSLYLDLVRYLAALTVFIGHAAGREWTGGILWQFGGYGQTAVMIFFVLSGFVIAHVTSTREQTVGDYTAARLARLWSVVLPALALTFVIDQIGLRIAPELYVNRPWYHGDDPGLRYLASALFVHDFWGMGLVPGVNGPFWSISNEFAYYFVFGAAMLVRHRVLGLTLAAAGLALAGPTIAVLFPVWLMGVLAYRWLRRPPPGKLAGSALFLGSLAVLLAAPMLRDHWLESYVFPSINRGAVIADYLDGAAFAVNIVAFGSVAPLLGPWLERWRKPIVYFASTSFALYLFHRPLLQLFAAIGPTPSDGWPRRIFVMLGIPLLVLLMTPPTERFKHVLRRWLLALLQRCGLHAAAPRQPG